MYLWLEPAIRSATNQRSHADEAGTTMHSVYACDLSQVYFGRARCKMSGPSEELAITDNAGHGEEVALGAEEEPGEMEMMVPAKEDSAAPAAPPAFATAAAAAAAAAAR